MSIKTPQFINCESMQPLSYLFSIMQIYETSIKTRWTIQLVNVMLLHLQQFSVNIMLLNPNFSPGDNVDMGARSVHPLQIFQTMSTWKQDVQITFLRHNSGKFIGSRREDLLEDDDNLLPCC